MTAPVPDEPGDDRGIDDGVTVVDPAEGVDEDGDVEDPLLQQVAAVFGVSLDEAHRKDRFDVRPHSTCPTHQGSPPARGCLREESWWLDVD